MLNLLFSPNGMIDKKAMWTGGFIIIAIGLVKNLVPYFIGENQVFGAISMLLMLVLAYCWVALWIKRYRGAGKSGAMCLIPIAVFAVAFLVVFFLTTGGIMADAFTMGMEYQGDQAALEAALEEKYNDPSFMKSLSLKYAIYTAIASTAVLALFNSIIGPATAMGETA